MEHTTATDRDDARSLFHKFVDGGLVEKLNMKVGEDNDQQEQEIDERSHSFLTLLATPLVMSVVALLLMLQCVVSAGWVVSLLAT